MLAGFSGSPIAKGVRLLCAIPQFTASLPVLRVPRSPVLRFRQPRRPPMQRLARPRRHRPIALTPQRLSSKHPRKRSSSPARASRARNFGARSDPGLSARKPSSSRVIPTSRNSWSIRRRCSVPAQFGQRRAPTPAAQNCRWQLSSICATWASTVRWYWSMAAVTWRASGQCVGRYQHDPARTDPADRRADRRRVGRSTALTAFGRGQFHHEARFRRVCAFAARPGFRSAATRAASIWR